MGAKEELIKAREAWQHQKDNRLSEARICDAKIEVFDAAIEMIEKDEAKAAEAAKAKDAKSD